MTLNKQGDKYHLRPAKSNKLTKKHSLVMRDEDEKSRRCQRQQPILLRDHSK